MQKKLLDRRVLTRLMRITFLQIIALLTCVSIAYSHDTYGQEILNRRISLNLSNQEMGTVLEKVENLANVKFLYSFEVIKANRKVSIEASNERLEKVLENLLNPLNIKFEVSSNQTIILKKGSNNEATTSEKNALGTPVTGVVLDEKNEPLVGVSIKVKGSNRGTTTNGEGKFSIELEKNDVMVVSYVGYLSQEVKLGNQTNFNISLQPDSQNFDEVVVVGYGTQSKKLVTSSISSVSAKELQEIKAPGLDQALQGRAAGVQVTKNTGAPGGGVSIRVRGTASLIGGQEPLYIIDGVPIANTPSGTSKVFVNANEPTGQAGYEYINPLAQIPVEDIESIDILKDAASASIYGARGANGVVIVTTKKGKAGKMQVSVNGYTGVNYVPQDRWYKMLSGTEYAKAVNQFITDANAYRAAQTPALAPYTKTFVYPDVNNVPNTNWQDEIFNAAPMSETNTNLSGGSDKATYSVSLGYFDQKGAMLNSKFTRYSLRSSFDFNINKNIKTGINLILSKNDGNRLRNNGVGFGTSSFNGDNVYGNSVLGAALAGNPAAPVRWSDGRYFVDSLNGGITAVSTAENFRMRNSELRTISNIYAEIKFPFLKGLKFRTNNGIDLRYSDETIFSPNVPGVYSSGSVVGALLEKGNYNEQIWISENFLTYDLNVGESHAINLLAGYSAQASRNDGMTVRGRAIPSNSLEIISAIPSTGLFLPLRDQGHQYWGIVSQFLRANYAFKNKYLFTGTIRRDGSSRFGPLNRYGNFPSASVGWLLSEEEFIKKIPQISFLKLRASYGITGNDQVGDVFTWRSSIQLNNGSLPQGYLGLSTSRPTSIEIGTFSWESTKQTDIGFELGLFKNRVFVNMDYYNRQSTDVLFGNIPIPATTGFTTITDNAASLENKGWEFSFDTKNIVRKNFKWNTTFNISFNKNKVLSLYEGANTFTTGDFGLSTLLKVGEPISFQAIQILGINPETGDYLPYNVPGTTDAIDANDLVVVGSPLPKHFGGLTNNLSYKNFDLSVFFNWTYGNKIFNTTRSYTEITSYAATGTNLGNPPRIRNIASEAYYGRWQKKGDIAEYRGFDFGNTYRAVQSLPTDYFLEDGSFLRLRSISLSYNIPSKFLKSLRIPSAKLYVNGNNLWLLTKYKGYDPEVSHFNTGENLRVGYDRGTFPQTRSFVGGFNLSF
jgi:TonB-dependent starch-binding outer membrane protein SusC